MTTKQLQRKIELTRDSLEQDLGGSSMDLVNELVELELLLERECNK